MCRWPICMGSAGRMMRAERSGSSSSWGGEVGSGGGGYSLNETPAPGPAPAGLVSFRDKYLKVYFTGDLGVNRTVLHWTPNEAVNFNESGIALYTWNGSGWLPTPNQTLDAASHSLTVLNLQNMFGDDTYGLFTTTNFTTTPGGGPSGGESTLSVGMRSNCSGNVVTVTSGGPVEFDFAPAVFTAINKDTAEMHHELVPFDADLAQRMSDRGVRILQATDAGELLPRVATTPDFFECRFCPWSERCWRLPA